MGLLDREVARDITSNARFRPAFHSLGPCDLSEAVMMMGIVPNLQ
jgi:hypothetical protein